MAPKGDRLDVEALRARIATGYETLRRLDVALGAPSDAFARRVGPGQPAPKKVKHVEPLYPPAAQTARVHGPVIVEVIIGIDGSVQDAEVLQSIPLLDQAALDAVWQWTFEPSTFSGVQTSIVTPVFVNFALR